jgi:hypothetical protein
LNKSIDFVGKENTTKLQQNCSQKLLVAPFEEHPSSNMVEANAFATRLTALGFEQPARTALAQQGLLSANNLLSLMTKDLEKLISHCQNKVRKMARDPAIPRPVFPFLAVKRLQALYIWTSF